MNSDTPRTDAAQWHDGQVYVVEASEARTLEKELSAVIARAEANAQARDEVVKAIATLLERTAKAEAERDEARAEVQEQARLNGMGSEREARLMAQVQELQQELDRLTTLAQCVLDARMDSPTALAYAVLQMKAALPIPTPKEPT